MAVTPDNQTLIVAESYANKLTAFDIADDGSLSQGRVWADLDGGVPDGICLDTENTVWYADVPTSVASAFAKVARCCRRSTLTARSFTTFRGAESRNCR
jgi:sugar lactone lactonase YvrE